MPASTQKKSPGRFCCPGIVLFYAWLSTDSDGTYVFRLWAFLAFTNREFYLLPFFEGFTAFHFNGAIVNEHITVTFASDETITFFVIEPLYGAYYFI